jgi:hypothetical protein
VFKDRAELVAHRGSPTERCYPKPPSLKEGIDDGQWDKLYHLKAKNDREKWFEIWRILFPGIPEPKNPCKCDLIFLSF